MLTFFRMLALSCFLAVATAVPQSTLTTIETVNHARFGWKRGERAAPGTELELTVAVSQENLPQLESTLLRLAAPGNAEPWLTQRQVHDLVAPAPAALAAVRKLLAAYGLVAKPGSPNSDLLTVPATVTQVEALLHTTYHVYTHAASKSTVVRCEAYSLPADVAQHVDLVAPTTHFPSTRAPLLQQPVAAPLATTPKVLRKIYELGNATGGQAPANRMAVTGFIKEYFQQGSFTKFYSEFGDSLPSGKTAPNIALKGDAPTGVCIPLDTCERLLLLLLLLLVLVIMLLLVLMLMPACRCIESMLDIEYSSSTGNGVPAEFWGFSGMSPDNKKNEPMLKWLTAVAAAPDATVPQLFSTSYGEDEDSVHTDPYS